ncbi:early nodulin-like protein 1 [Rhodamnia argentea]|uniref:Early nodulin-like protein 1 n=1 Tax=Rhodamnia argentea TaxID=178133 RepID=A0A8B8NHX2_9MYRT|nr:early nodulin-like protein 1 [Rhodamnia argentea]
MATPHMGSCKLLLPLLLISSLQVFLVASTEFTVGGEGGWGVQKPNKNRDMYNEWASRNRFKVDDTIHFQYQKDSVMVVTSEEYDKCRSSHPLFYSNNGDTVFTLDRPGLFYFISGVAGHCERGERMIIKVLETEETLPPQSANENSTETSHSSPMPCPTSSVAGAVALFAVSFLA